MAGLVRGLESAAKWTYNRVTDPSLLFMGAGVGIHYLDNWLLATGQIDEQTARVNEAYAGVSFGVGVTSFGKRIWSWAHQPKALERMSKEELKAEYTATNTKNKGRMAKIKELFDAIEYKERPAAARTSAGRRESVAREALPVAAPVVGARNFSEEEVGQILAQSEAQAQLAAREATEQAFQAGKKAAEDEFRPAFEDLVADFNTHGREEAAPYAGGVGRGAGDLRRRAVTPGLGMGRGAFRRPVTGRRPGTPGVGGDSSGRSYL